MECPVCYTDTCNCKLTCGHNFCRSCIKEWYMKTDSEPSCPMCRSSLYFKGMGKLVDRWEDESYEKKWDEIYTECFEETVEQLESEGELDVIMDYIEDLENAYKKLRDVESKGLRFPWVYIREILLQPYCMYDFVVSQRNYMTWDDNEEIRLRHLFVSNYPSWNGPRIVRAV